MDPSNNGAVIGGPAAPLVGVLHNLKRNHQQLQLNLAAAAARLPLAHSSDGLAKAFEGVPAMLAAAAARLGSAPAAAAHQRQQVAGAAAAQQFQKQQPQPQQQQQRGRRKHKQPAGEVVCTEYTEGKRRVYHRSKAATADGEPGGDSWEIADDVLQHRQRLSTLASEYLLPQGYPDSVAPQYAPYMRARAWQYLFGGALSVFTTRSLLASLGVANKASGEAAAAINWAVKDGAGRLGRFLFARWGRDLDCELKQFRLAGDLLMEAGAALELSTAMVPGAFLPLACTANLAKNLAAVAIVSTRAPIYRTFALRNNLADVTAKGESVANLADVVGTALGIALAKFNLPVVPTFTALSLGYIIASRVEVDTVILPYLNRARLSYVARSFCQTGAVPGLEEGNRREPIMPWRDPHVGRVVLGATVEEACAGPQQLHEALGSFSGRQYALTYRRDTGKCYALLKQGASTQSVLQAALDAHCLLWLLDNAAQQQKEAAVATGLAALPAAAPAPDPPAGGGVAARLQAAVRELGSVGDGNLAGQLALDFVSRSDHYREFQRQAEQTGWRLHMTSLNPRETRLALA